jgi:quercetin dioxygenase-like cupin family protein
MFYKKVDGGYREAMKGVSLKTLTYGEKTLLAEFLLTGGEILPTHAHPHEQIGYLVSGSLLLDIGGESFEVKPGDSWCIPGNVPHGAKILADSVAIEVFSPVREDFLPARG